MMNISENNALAAILALIAGCIGSLIKQKQQVNSTTWDDLPMDVKRIIFKVQRTKHPFPATSSDGWPRLNNGVNTTWRQALPIEVIAQIEAKIEAKISPFELHQEWKLEEVRERLLTIPDYCNRPNAMEEQDIFEMSEAANPGFAVWLVHDIPVYRTKRNLDSKVMDNFQELYLKAGRPDIIWGQTDINLYINSLDDDTQWLKKAEKLMEKKDLTLYDVYDNLWNDTNEMVNYFRKDIASYGW